MAQSNHHGPDSSASELQRPASRHCGGADQPHPDLLAFMRHILGATRLSVTAIDGPRIAGVRVCIGRTRP